MEHIEQLKLEFYNPYIDKQDSLVINRPIYDFVQWFGFSRVYYDVDDIDIIKSLLKDLNCCKLFKDKPYRRPTDIMYKIILAQIFYFMLRLTNQFEYNHVIDTLNTIHELNLMFIHDYDNEHKTVQTKTKTTRKRKTSKAATIDMFTGEQKIVEVDDKTGKIIKPKHKFSNVGNIPLDHMFFNFKKK